MSCSRLIGTRTENASQVQEEHQHDGSDGEGDRERYDRARWAADRCSLMPTSEGLAGTRSAAPLGRLRFLSLS
jgi:hypothetical protein